MEKLLFQITTTTWYEEKIFTMETRCFECYNNHLVSLRVNEEIEKIEARLRQLDDPTCFYTHDVKFVK
jgi:hypothetical protein